jgi:hypothetical protein
LSRRPAQPEALTWEPGRLYWAVLHAPGWKRAGVLPPGLRPELEDELPLAPDDLHAVCAPVGDGRVVVCAAARTALAAVPANAPRLVPATVPACIDAQVSPASLNLLVGEFEPVVMRRARRRLHLLAAASLALCAAFATAGLLRRAAFWDGVASSAAEARSGLLTAAGLDTADPHALIIELAELRRQAEAAATVRPPADAAVALADLLKGWPAAVPAKPQSLAVSPTGATISVNVDGDPAPFLAALRTPDGWRAGEPRINASGGVTRLTLQLTRTAGEVGQ